MKIFLINCLFVYLSLMAARAAESPDAYVSQGDEAYRKGNYEESWVAYEKALALEPGTSVLHYNAACSYALAGRREDAFRHLFAALDAGYAEAELVSQDTDLASLHSDSRWHELLEGMRVRERAAKLRWGGEAFRSGYRDRLTDEEKVAGLSRVWAEAKFGFANFDLAPELDWDARYRTFIPRVMEAESTYEYYRLLQEFIAGLKDGHSNVYPPRELHAKYARPPLRTGLIENRIVIREVMNAAAEAAGFRKGQEIIAIDGVSVEEHARSEVRPYQSASTPQDLAVRTYDYLLLAGDISKPVTLRILDLDGTQRTLVAGRLSGAERGRLQPESFELAWLPGGIAHVRLNSFGDRDVVEGFERALPDLAAHARGIVLDVRDNGGGSSDNGYAILAHFSDTEFATTTWEVPKYTATWRAWGRPQKIDGPHAQSWPGAGNKFNVPTAVLIGPRTYSAAEDFAVAFDQMERGVLVGEATGGSTGQPLMFDLPGGGTGRICTKRDRYADGTEFVGVGVQPDIQVAITFASVRSGEDPVLQRAVEWIEAQ